jgi:hypothetical protein
MKATVDPTDGPPHVLPFKETACSSNDVIEEALCFRSCAFHPDRQRQKPVNETHHHSSKKKK